MSIVPYTPGNIPTYRFYINTFSSVTYEVFPLNFLDTSIVIQQEPGQVFYRRKFEGQLVFGTNDKVLDDSGVEQNRMDDWSFFGIFHEYDPCERLYLTINKIVSGVTEVYWEGYFSTSNGEWDYDNCTFTVTPFVNDDYVELLAQGDIEYSIYTDALFYNSTVLNDGTTLHSYEQGALITELIEYLAQQIIPAITLDSSFLQDATNPVTGTDNRYNHLTLHYKRDIKEEGLGLTVTTIMMSFNGLMELLKCMNLYWDYDGTDLIVEHISNWPDVPGIDITNQLTMVARNKFKYLDVLPKYELYEWSEANNEDFIGQKIWYDSDCVCQDPASNTTSSSYPITTDIEYIIQCMADPDTEDQISDDGWVLLSNYEDGGDLYVNINVGLLDTTTAYFNMDMSWSYLHNLFFKDDRALLEGYMNGVLTDFYTARKNKQQECSIVLCDELDPTETLITELGTTYLDGATGKIEKASVKPTGEVNLTLLYGPVAVVNPGVTYENIILIIEDGDLAGTNCDYTAVLSEITLAQLDIGLTVTIHDSLGVACVATGTLTILANALTGTVNIDWCTPGGATPPLCRFSVADDGAVTAPGWTIYYKLDETVDC
jgi:hypothetical protein